MLVTAASTSGRWQKFLLVCVIQLQCALYLSGVLHLLLWCCPPFDEVELFFLQQEIQHLQDLHHSRAEAIVLFCAHFPAWWENMFAGKSRGLDGQIIHYKAVDDRKHRLWTLVDIWLIMNRSDSIWKTHIPKCKHVGSLRANMRHTVHIKFLISCLNTKMVTQQQVNIRNTINLVPVCDWWAGVSTSGCWVESALFSHSCGTC